MALLAGGFISGCGILPFLQAPRSDSVTGLRGQTQKSGSNLMAKGSRTKHPRGQTLRIIGGKWRSRRLPFPDCEGLRPTPDRVRETLFNWLAPWLTDAHCLDLFAGSGALGLEALSRGAAQLTAIEQNPTATAALEQHRDTLGAGETMTLLKENAVHWLPKTPMQWDIIFLDPPFNTPLLAEAIQLLPQHLKPGSLIYTESEKNAPHPPIPANWSLHREKIAGQVRYALFRVE